MNVIDRDTDGAIVRLSRDELYMLAQAVHTVCDGASIGASEFVTIMGWDQGVYMRLCDQVRDAYRTST
jgi:hypothetical protein